MNGHVDGNLSLRSKGGRVDDQREGTGRERLADVALRRQPHDDRVRTFRDGDHRKFAPEAADRRSGRIGGRWIPR